MALGQIRNNSKYFFEGDFKLISFDVGEFTTKEGTVIKYGKYTLRSVDGQLMSLSGWADSGADKLELDQLYHFYFSYDLWNKTERVRVVGVNPNLICDVKMKSDITL